MTVEEASPSPVYGAALLMRFGFIAHRGFKSLRLRRCSEPPVSDIRRGLRIVFAGSPPTEVEAGYGSQADLVVP